ncbi:hypothetical protein Shyhy01_21170 [Streptomyces hygroscopicus subsp. hygroscopicus]|nr:hypothetical protein Shyhy01_21170 [Streptomyces hygroscopicus subsp. hygroscopicus]
MYRFQRMEGGPPGKRLARGRVISVEDWAEIRQLHRSEGMPIRAIARDLTDDGTAGSVQ